MSNFTNTVDVIGDELLTAQIIDRSVTEFNDDTIVSVGDSAFYECKALTTINLPAVKTAGGSAFKFCTNLTMVNLPKLESVGGSIFNSAGLNRLCLPSLKKTVDQFIRDSKVVVLDLPACESIEGWGPFYGLRNVLKAIVLRNSTVCSVPNPTNAFMNYVDNSTIFGASTCYVYVPSALVDTYKAATNWSNFAEYIRPLEDYTVDGTTTGELDESKI